MKSTTEPSVQGGLLRGTFVMLRAGGLQLLLPQYEVPAVDHLPPEQRELQRSDGVIALSEQLRPLPSVPANRFVITQLLGSPVAFAWDAVRMLLAVDLPWRALPAALRTPDLPVDAYLELDGAPVLCTTARRLLEFALNGKA
jgi:hypothetical protein